MDSHSKHTISIFLIGISLFGTCKSPETIPASEASIGLNKPARVGADLTMQIDTIHDYRCPIDVQCISGGDAAVSLSLSKGIETQKRKLFLYGQFQKERTDSTTVRFGSSLYSVVLRDVVPHRSYTDTSRDQQAVIRVTKL